MRSVLTNNLDNTDYDMYVSDRALFRKKLRSFTTTSEVADFLEQITSYHLNNYSNFTYKLHCPNKYDIAVSEIIFYKNDSVSCYFEYEGARRYKTFSQFTYNAYLVKHPNYSSEALAITCS